MDGYKEKQSPEQGHEPPEPIDIHTDSFNADIVKFSNRHRCELQLRDQGITTRRVQICNNMIAVSNYFRNVLHGQSRVRENVLASQSKFYYISVELFRGMATEQLVNDYL